MKEEAGCFADEAQPPQLFSLAKKQLVVESINNRAPYKISGLLGSQKPFTVLQAPYQLWELLQGITRSDFEVKLQSTLHKLSKNGLPHNSIKRGKPSRHEVAHIIRGPLLPLPTTDIQEVRARNKPEWVAAQEHHREQLIPNNEWHMLQTLEVIPKAPGICPEVGDEDEDTDSPNLLEAADKEGSDVEDMYG